MKKTNLTEFRKPNEHYFFGYYDLQPYSTDHKKHLAHRVDFMDRIPVDGEAAEVGYIDVEGKEFIPLAKTVAWNYQQGAFLQWFVQDESISFNDFDGKNYVNRIVDLKGKEIRRYGRPFATMNAKVGKALSINFCRIYDFRKGYGYCNVKDSFANISAPEEDGIYCVDLNSGNSNLLISYAQMKELFSESPFTDSKLVVNHITFSPDGTKFVFLLRNFPESGKAWGTVLAVGDLNGNVKKLTNFEVNSHYSWKDERTLMIYSGLPEWGIYFFNVETGERSRLNDEKCDADDIHCNYSHARDKFIGDGYPRGGNASRPIFLFDFNTCRSEELIRVYSVPVNDLDIRCDLHARWSLDDKMISYDTTENGVREIMQIEL